MILKVFVLLVCLYGVSCYWDEDEREMVEKTKILKVDMDESVEDVPYYVQVFDEMAYELCGGVIISEYWVLTAYSCVQSANTEKIDVRSSAYVNMYNPRDPRPHARVSEVVWNSNFGVALLKLKKPLELDGVRTKAIKIKSEGPLSLEIFNVTAHSYDYDAKEPKRKLVSFEVLAEVVNTKSCTIRLKTHLRMQRMLRADLINKFCVSRPENEQSLKFTGEILGAPAVTIYENLLLGIATSYDTDQFDEPTVVFEDVTTLADWIKEYTGLD